nr:hypothetical protein [Tanacetum cinerariifolium]
GQHYTGDQPQGAGQVAHLRCQNRADERTCASDGREVVAEQNVFVGRNVIKAVIVDHRRRGPGRIELHDVIGDEQAVVAVR